MGGPPSSELSCLLYATHKQQLAPEDEHVISERVATLEQHAASAYSPAGAKRLRADVTQLAMRFAPHVPAPRPAGAQQLSWEDLIALAAKPVPTERCLPPALNGLLTEVIQALLQQHTADTGAPTASLMYFLPKLCWPTFAIRPQGHPAKGRQRQRLISQRLQAVLQEQAVILYHEAMQKPDVAPRMLPVDLPAAGDDPILTPQQASRLLTHVARGEQSAALRRLEGQTLAPPTKTSWDAAWTKLNPELEPEIISPAPL